MYNRKNQKVKFKLRIEFVGIIAAIIIMIGLSVVLRLPSEKQKFLNSFAGSSLTIDHLYNEVKYEELLKKIESDEYVYVFFGTPENASSVKEISTVNDIAVEYNIEELIYFDSAFVEEEDREEDEKHDEKLKDMEKKLSAKQSEDVTAEFSLDYAPQLWVFKSGELVFNSYDFFDEDDTLKLNSWSTICYRAFRFNLELVEDTNE